MFSSRRTPQRTLLPLCLFLLIPFLLTAQSGKISGRVLSEDKTALEAVTVMVKGKPSGTVVTLANGSFVIAAAPGDSLSFSYTGYEPQLLAVQSARDILVTMTLTNSKLQDVVVIGYGTQKAIHS